MAYSDIKAKIDAIRTAVQSESVTASQVASVFLDILDFANSYLTTSPNASGVKFNPSAGSLASGNNVQQAIDTLAQAVVSQLSQKQNVADATAQHNDLQGQIGNCLQAFNITPQFGSYNLYMVFRNGETASVDFGNFASLSSFYGGPIDFTANNVQEAIYEAVRKLRNEISAKASSSNVSKLIAEAVASLGNAVASLDLSVTPIGGIRIEYTTVGGDSDADIIYVPASAISFDRTGTKFASTTVQAALVELLTKLTNANGVIDSLLAEISSKANSSEVSAALEGIRKQLALKAAASEVQAEIDRINKKLATKQDSAPLQSLLERLRLVAESASDATASANDAATSALSARDRATQAAQDAEAVKGAIISLLDELDLPTLAEQSKLATSAAELAALEAEQAADNANQAAEEASTLAGRVKKNESDITDLARKTEEKIGELERKTSGLDAITDNVELNSIVKELLIPQSIYDAASWIRVYNGFSGLYGISIYDSSNQYICTLYTNSNIPYISNPQGGSVVGDWSKLGNTQYKDFKGITINTKVTSAEFNPIISSMLNNASLGTLRNDVSTISSELKKLELTTSDELNQIIRELYIPESRFSDYLGVTSIRVWKCYRISDTNYRNGIGFYKNGVLTDSFYNAYPTLSAAQEDLTETPFVAGALIAVVNWDKVENDDKAYSASFPKVPSLLDQKTILADKSLIMPSYTITEHKFVFSDGSIQGNGTTTDAAYTSPIVCKKGDKLSIFATASTAMSVVSVFKDGHYIPKVLGDGTKWYEYVCEEDSLIVVSYTLSNAFDIIVFSAGIWETYVMEKLGTIPAPYEPGSAYYFEGAKISPNAAREHFVYEGDTKKTSNYIVNAVVYPNGEIIAARQGGSIVKIALDGTETTLLTINGASDWRGLFMDSNLNVYASPHASVGSSGGFAMTDRGLYKLAYGSDSFVKVISLYDPSSADTPETQSNDDTIWTMCEDADGYLYGGVYCHTQRYAPRIYRSADGGNTWVDYYNFLPILPNGHHVHCIIYNEYNNALYAIIGEVNTILKSTDHGQTWTNLNLACEGDKGTAMIAVPDGVIIGSDGAYELTMSKMNVDETKITTRGRVWANTCFGTRKSDVTGWIYAFGKIDSSVNSTSYMPPVSAISDASALQSWKDSSPAHLSQWEKYHNYTKNIYPDDCIRPQHFAILVSKDNGNTWEVAYREQVSSTSANGIWCVGYFKNGECLCGRFIGNQVKKPLIISEGKHKYSENGVDLAGEIFIRTNTDSYIDYVE